MPGTASIPKKRNNNQHQNNINLTSANPQNKSLLKKMGKIDLTFMFIIMILMVFGVIMMYSASYAWAIDEDLSGDFYFRRQAGHALLGFAFMFLASFFDYHYFAKYPLILVYGVFAVSTVLMLLTIFGPASITQEESDAKRWLDLPILPQFQPSEVLKFAVILMFAYLISNNFTRRKKFWFVVPVFGCIFAVVLAMLAAQRHVSAILITCLIGAIMLFVADINPWHLLFMAVVGALALYGIINIMKEGGMDYIASRVTAFADPLNDSGDANSWQIKNSLIAIGSGGLTGLGFGNSRQKFLYLPESKNDFVFAIVCEELGFAGALTVMILFVLLILRGFYIAVNAPDKFGMLLAVGLTVQIGLQAMLNIAVVSNAFPCTGVSLPFFSYGGTALVLQLAQMGIVLNISRQSLKKT
ncbi:MAG: cell division protein FtsW [Oscillospiraceae bacterium]|nr:cell division protein FtsW [Oscillospiraceae bacterium]